MKVYTIENSLTSDRQFFGKKQEAYDAFAIACRRQPYLVHTLKLNIAKKQQKDTMLAMLRDDGWEASTVILERYSLGMKETA